MGVKKKTKVGRDKVDGFDATPPDDGDMHVGNGKRPNLPANPLKEGQQGIKKMFSSYKLFLITAFRNAPREQQESWVQRLALTCCIGIACVILNCFYSVLLPPIRIISLPLIVGGAWFIANRMVAPAIITRLGNNMNN